MTNDELNRRFGEGLRAMREGRGISLCAFAKEAGIAKSSISFLERGINCPKLDTVNAISKALGYDRPDWFLLDVLSFKEEGGDA